MFLDVDGVLNCQTTTETSPSGMIGIGNVQLNFLKELIDETNSLIVLSSTWRLEFDENLNSKTDDAKYLIEKLNEKNLKIYDMLRKEMNQYDSRGTQIVDWISEHPQFKKFLILDDEYFNYRELNLKYFVKTNFYGVGLNKKAIKKSIYKLKQQKEMVDWIYISFIFIFFTHFYKVFSIVFTHFYDEFLMFLHIFKKNA